MIRFWTLRWWVAAGLLGCMAATAADSPGDKPQRTEISETPWVYDPWAAGEKVIYGADDRIDVYQETNATHRIWAASTCALISMSKLTAHADGSYTLTPGAYNRFGLPACASEPFGSQPVAPYCTGFMVGSDLIVTAGHCYDSSDFFGTRFVFGFEMLDAGTPRLEFEASRVYTGVEIVSASASGDNDHCLVRVDRPITAPNARPFVIRREGVIAVGEQVGVIGYPAGLPLKLAFGANTVVRDSSSAGYFVANTDTYVGNSGSPIINAGTGVLEGILVRGDTDYVNTGSCFTSFTQANSDGRGEDATRTSAFMDNVPLMFSGTGVVATDQTAYQNNAVVGVSLADADLAGTGLASVAITTGLGDHEVLVLTEDAITLGRFSGAITVTNAAATVDDGALQSAAGDTLTVTYNDARDSFGNSRIATATAIIDTQPPVISAVAITYASGSQATITFTTNEPATPNVAFGLDCAALDGAATGVQNTSHVVTLNGLAYPAAYAFIPRATDAAGNTGEALDNGTCFILTTLEIPDYFTELFTTDHPVDLAYATLTFTPADTAEGYTLCRDQTGALPVDPTGGQPLTVTDDDYAQVAVANGNHVYLYGQAYDTFFVGSNGYITFSQGSTQRTGSLDNHFGLPRVAAMFADLNPEKGGAISVLTLSNRVAVTFQNVPTYDGRNEYPAENSHTFQMELFFNGVIRISWLSLYTQTGLAGLSRGVGAPTDFAATDLSSFDSCNKNGRPHNADQNGDFSLSLTELMRVIQFYNSDGYHCDPDGEEGYAPGPGNQECGFHDSDYSPADWQIVLAELLRLVQIFNAGAYTVDSNSEDGYRPLFPHP